MDWSLRTFRPDSPAPVRHQGAGGGGGPARTASGRRWWPSPARSVATAAGERPTACTPPRRSMSRTCPTGAGPRPWCGTVAARQHGHGQASRRVVRARGRQNHRRPVAQPVVGHHREQRPRRQHRGAVREHFAPYVLPHLGTRTMVSLVASTSKSGWRRCGRTALANRDPHRPDPAQHDAVERGGVWDHRLQPAVRRQAPTPQRHPSKGSPDGPSGRGAGRGRRGVPGAGARPCLLRASSEGGLSPFGADTSTTSGKSWSREGWSRFGAVWSLPTARLIGSESFRSPLRRRRARPVAGAPAGRPRGADLRDPARTGDRAAQLPAAPRRGRPIGGAAGLVHPLRPAP